MIEEYKWETITLELCDEPRNTMGAKKIHEGWRKDASAKGAWQPIGVAREELIVWKRLLVRPISRR